MAAVAEYVGGDLIVYLVKLVYGRNKLKNTRERGGGSVGRFRALIDFETNPEILGPLETR